MDLAEKLLGGSAKEFEEKVEDKLSSEKLKAMFKKCFLNTLETTVKTLDDSSIFIITGDINAMWLRDSSCQVRQYLALCKKDSEACRFFESLISKQIEFILKDPYANAFNPQPNGLGHNADKTQMTPWIFERKYEIDSLCYPVALAYEYYKTSGRTEVFDEKFHDALKVMLSVFKKEQNHSESEYTFERLDCPESDTLKNGGKGTPVNYTGMSWTGFRPSDDAAVYGYNIPENMFLSTALCYIIEICRNIYKDESLLNESQKLKEEIDSAIKKYGIIEDDTVGEMYAYETDGFGKFNLMDDANVPSLLAIPYFGYPEMDKEIYNNTRKFILSKKNPYYFCGSEACGIGSPHTPKGYIWPISLIIEALTTDDKSEIIRLVTLLMKTDANTDFMHESFDCNNAKKFTRSWFAWANSLFSYLIIELYNKGFDFKKIEF